MDDMSKVTVSFILFLALLFLPRSVIAEYVLPYPSYMPGNKIYKIARVIDELKRFWYWGSIGSVKYHMGLSDKYLVEAKTLFEYKQYLLAIDALKRSDHEFLSIHPQVARAKTEGKDIAQFEQTIKEVSQAHVIIIEKLIQMLPAEFSWTPEKNTSTWLPIRAQLQNAAILRR